jgi:hypothetical protein
MAAPGLLIPKSTRRGKGQKAHTQSSLCSGVLHLLSKVAIIKDHKLGGLVGEIYCLTVLEARSPKSVFADASVRE